MSTNQFTKVKVNKQSILSLCYNKYNYNEVLNKFTNKSGLDANPFTLEPNIDIEIPIHEPAEASGAAGSEYTKKTKPLEYPKLSITIRLKGAVTDDLYYIFNFNAPNTFTQKTRFSGKVEKQGDDGMIEIVNLDPSYIELTGAELILNHEDIMEHQINRFLNKLHLSELENQPLKFIVVLNSLYPYNTEMGVLQRLNCFGYFGNNSELIIQNYQSSIPNSQDNSGDYEEVMDRIKTEYGC